MQSTSRALSILAVASALIGLSIYALAGTLTASLPASNAISGWEVMSGGMKSGEMGGKSSYDAYDGAVEAMKGQGIKYFAQQMYKNKSTKHYLTVDVFQLTSGDKATALYNTKLTGYRNAKPVNKYTSIKDKASVGTMGTVTFGLMIRGKYLCEISMSKANTSDDRTIAKSFLARISSKLGG